MLMRAIRNYKLFKAQRLSQKGEYGRATQIIDKLLERHPNAIVFNLLAADTKLYSGDLPAALEQFHFVKQLIDRQETIKAKNKRFLAAYTNYKIKGITLKIENKPFPKAFEFTKQINGLEADRNLKALFPLPE